jgi:ABC-type dipeptide/oligopeptide/nickel transport system permease component
MILGLTVALTVLVLVVNLIADVLMAIIDPRMREQRT